jgi:hypothetical protein
MKFSQSLPGEEYSFAGAISPRPAHPIRSQGNTISSSPAK